MEVKISKIFKLLTLRDKILIFVCGVLSTSSLYMFSNTHSSREDRVRAEHKSGSLIVKQGRARIKRRGDVEWSAPTSDKSIVKNHDRIHIYAGSSGLLDLDKVGQVYLDENSIIKVGKSDDTIEFLKGNLKIKLIQGKKLNIKVGKKRISAFSRKRGATLRVKASKRGIEVKADSTRVVTKVEEVKVPQEKNVKVTPIVVFEEPLEEKEELFGIANNIILDEEPLNEEDEEKVEEVVEKEPEVVVEKKPPQVKKRIVKKRKKRFKKKKRRALASTRKRKFRRRPSQMSLIRPNFKPSGYVGVEPKIRFSKIEATGVRDGVSSTVYSDLSYGITASWKFMQTTIMDAWVYVDIDQRRFQPNPNRLLTEDSVSTINIGVGAHYRFGKHFFLESTLGYGEEVFLNAPDTLSIRFDKASTFKGRVGLGFKVTNLEPFYVLTDFGVMGVLGTDVEDYTSETGLGYYARLRIAREYKRLQLVGDVLYENQNKDTSNFAQLHTELLFRFGVNWSYDKK